MHNYYAHAAVLSFVHVFPGNSAVSDPTVIPRRTVDVSCWPVSQEIWTLGNLVAASKFPRKSGRSASKFPRKFGRS